MGTYLSTPVTEKCEESGEALCDLKSGDIPVEWGVVDMQGWRKSMEDAHTAVTSVELTQANSSSNTSSEETATETGSPSQNLARVFGVYDGHGGAEVARFCQHYFVSVLTHQESWANGEELPLNGDDARVPTPPPSPTTAYDGNGNEPGYRANHLVAASETPVGKALREAFHAMDRMIDDPSRRGQIGILRSTKAGPGVTKSLEDGLNSIPPVSTVLESPPDFYTQAANGSDKTATATLTATATATQVADSILDQTTEEVLAAAKTKEGQVDEETAKEVEAKQFDRSLSMAISPEDAEVLKEKIEEYESNEKETSDTSNSNAEDGDSVDSNEAVGQEEAAVLDSNIDDDDNDKKGETISSSPGKGRNVTTMLQKILSLGGSGDSKADASETPASEPVQEATPDPQYPDASNVNGASPRIPSVQTNGRLVCNLPDHPIHAGATAVVAVMTGQILTVANAGDSRAVLCRRRKTADGGHYAYPMSYDHKPSQAHEFNRILRSGGFVNHFGRINGNLNLSRSIGDLKYKQVPGIPPPHQMITAEPDVMQIALEPNEDEFLILGCDGIWDCLTNEQAVNYVKSRIDTKSPTEIGREMLDQIISDDPRVTQGIGGDNMTIMIIDFQSTKRSRCAADIASADAAAADSTTTTPEAATE